MILRRKEKKPLLIVLTVIVVLALVTVIMFSAICEHRADKLQKEYEEAVSDLQQKRSELLLEYSNVESVEYAKLGYSAALSMIFKGANKMLYEDIFPIFTKEDGANGALTGIICLSPSEMPGDEGMMSLEQFAEMIEAGWTAAVLFDGEGDLALYIELMRYNLELLGVATLDTVLFWDDSYDTSYDSVLLAEGIKYAVQGKSSLFDPIEQRADSDIVLLPGYIGWNNGAGKGAKYVYEHIVTRGGVSSFIVSFPKTVNGSSTSDITMDYTAARKDSFTRLIENNLLVEYNKGKLLVGSFGDAFAAREGYLKAKEEAQPRIEAIKADLKARIAEVEMEILNIYYQYGGK